MPGTVTPHGEALAVRTPYDRALLPVLRALPRARWSKSDTAWLVSGDDADLPAVLAAAAAHGWTIDPGIRARAERLATVQDAEATTADAHAKDARLYPYQRLGVRWLARQTRALLADQQGLGKTCQLLCALPAGAPVVVIAPAAVKGVWAQEATTWRPDYRVEILSGRGSFRWPGWGEVLICNYDILPAHDAPLPPASSGTVLVADEVQNCKGRTTRRTLAVQRLARLCARVYGASGTPLMSRPPELYQVLDTLGLAEATFGSFGRFYRAFGACKHPRGHGTLWGNPRAEVPGMLARVMLRRERATVLPDLPGKRWQRIDVNGLAKGLRTQLDEAGVEWDAWVAEAADERADAMPPFELLSRVRAELAEAKIPALLAQVEHYESIDEPLVVFSAHRAPVDALAAREGWARISGDETAEQRTEIVRRFQAGELRGVAATIQAGGIGLTLTRAAVAIFVDLAWTPAANEQAEDRICRIGQDRGCLYVHLVAEHAVDRRVRRLLHEKGRLIAATIAPAATATAPATLREALAIVTKGA